MFLLGFGLDFNPSALSNAFSTALIVVESSVFSAVVFAAVVEVFDEDEAGPDDGEAVTSDTCWRSLVTVAVAAADECMESVS